MDLPLPNDIIDGSIVIASVWGNDEADPANDLVEFVNLLLLNKEGSSNYRIVQLTADGEIILQATHDNITKAVNGEWINTGGTGAFQLAQGWIDLGGEV